MERTSAQLILKVLELGLQFGIPAVISMFEAWDKDEITDEDVQALGLEMKKRSTDALREPME